MLTRRQVVIEKPFQDRRYTNHRRKVHSALPRIDTGPPATHAHLEVKLKKLRLETDRQDKVCKDNLRLLHKLAVIMRTKRVDHVNTSSKGPFTKTTTVTPRTPRARKSVDSELGTSFLEKVTNEATRRLPLCKRELIEHRAPHGYCPVPQLGITLIQSAYGMTPRKGFHRTTYSIKTGAFERRSTSEGDTLPSVECLNKSVQISLSDVNQATESNNLSFFTEETTNGEAEDLEDEYSQSFSKEGDSAEDAEIVNQIINENPSETESSEAAGGDDSVLSCSGFSDTEDSATSDKTGGNKSPVCKDSSVDHATSRLLASAPSITIDEPSDDDFFHLE